MLESGIYAIINIYNDKCYVGSAIDLRHRWKTHIWYLKNNKHANIKLQRCFRKHWINPFIFTTLEYCEKEKLIKQEQYWIDKLKPEYNICLIAGNSLGVKGSDERKRKISISLLGRKITNEHKENIRVANLGKVLSTEHKNKISKSHLGKKFSEESKNKMSLSRIGHKRNLGKKHSEESKKKMSLIRKEFHNNNFFGQLKFIMEL